jgi:hypothetical protein
MRLWGLRPDFLCSLVALAHFMRLSLKKAAYAVASSAAYRKSGAPHRFRPRYATANLGHPSYPFGLCYVIAGQISYNAEQVVRVVLELLLILLGQNYSFRTEHPCGFSLRP